MTTAQGALPSHVVGPPAAALDVSRWELALPEPDPATGGMWDVRHPDLTTFVHPRCWYLGDDGMVWFVAPVAGRATTDVGGTRCQLRELRTDRDPASWGMGDGVDHVLAATLTCDATSIAGRRECIVGMIHDGTPTPPVYLAVNQNELPGRLVLFWRGRAHARLLAEVGPTDVFSLRLTVTGRGRARHCYVAAAMGEETPPGGVALRATEFAAQRSGCFFKAGAYNREPVNGSGVGASVVRVARLMVV